MKYLSLLLLGAILVLGVHGKRRNPLKDPTVCGRPQCGASRKFKYAPGVYQKYDYTIDISTHFSGNQNSSKLHIGAKVALAWLTPCEAQLSLAEVVLKEAPDVYDRIEDIDYETLPLDNSPLFAQALQEHPLRFGFEDGAVTELCPHEEEPTWVLNAKRGILSLMHNTMERLDVDFKTIETDIHGVCPTVYHLEGAHGTSLVIHKSKKLLECDDRHRLQSVVQTSDYRTRQGQPKVLPLLKSSLDCQLSIDHNVYNQIECRQVHSFEPFSQKGATTTTTQKLKLLLEDDDPGMFDRNDLEKRTNLLYDHYHTPKPTIGELKSARRLVKNMCDLGEGHEMFSDHFSRYIRSARLISYTALYHLYLKTSTVCYTGRKHFLDALPFLSSTASVELMKKLIIDRKVSQDVVNDWMMTLSLIPSPEESMLVPLRQLLEAFPDNPVISLAVSSVAHSFCKNFKDCDESEKLFAIIEVLTSRLKERKDLATLKAIGNIGVKTDDLDELLMTIVLHDDLPVEARLAAVEAYRRFDCQEVQPDFLSLLGDQKLNSEIRIASYLQVMRCPSYQIIDTIRSILETEEVNQVGSFIWTHLGNLGKSSMPRHLDIQTILYGKDLVKKFSNDVRKFSTNFAGSAFLNEYNFGGSYDSNLVFSTDSYVPRTGMLNLTIDMFGESMNVMELTGRAEGLERFAESFLGPDGPVSGMKKKLKRWTRSTDNEVIKAGIESLPNVLKNKFGDPRLSLGMKIFGNELKFWQFKGYQEIGEALKSFNPLDHIKTLLSGRQISYQKVNMFLDSSLVVPTSTGFPIILNVLGTSSINLKLFGSVKGGNFSNLEVFGNFRPSATFNVIGAMSVDAYYASTDVKIRSNAHTSTAIEGHVKFRGMNLVSAKFTLPKEKTELVSASSELIVMKDNQEEVQNTETTARTDCSLHWGYKIFGLTVCTKMVYPEASFLGPMKFSMTVPKADPTAKTYQVDYAWGHHDNQTEIIFLYATPGSLLKKHLLANLTIDHANQTLAMFTKSTDGVVLSNGRYRNVANEKFLYLDVETNGKKNLDFGASLTRKINKNVQVFSPRLYIAMNNERIVDFNGSVRLITKVLQVTEQYEVDLNFKMKNMTSNINGQVTRSLQTSSTNLNFTYTFSNYSQEFISVDFKTSTIPVNSIKTLQVDYRFEASEFPKLNTEAVSKVQQSLGRMEAKFDVNYGLQWKDPDHLLTLQYSYLSSTKSDGKKLSTYILAKQTYRNLDFKSQLIFDQTGPSINTIGILQFAKEKTFSINIYLHAPRSSLLFLETRVNFTVPTYYPLLWEMKIHEKLSREFDVEVKGQWFNGHDLSAKGRYQDRSTITASSQYLKFIVQSDQFEDINLSVIQLQDQSDFKLEIKGLQAEKEYSFIVKHSVNGSHLMNTLAQLKLDYKLYYITSSIEMLDHQQLLLDCHFDQWRDLSLKLRGITQEKLKQLDFEIKWDVNRDPYQKLSTFIEYQIPTPHKYTGKFNLNYPGRSLDFNFDFAPEHLRYSTRTKYTWNYEKFIEVSASSESTIGETTSLTVRSDVATSFVDWEKISSKFHSSFGSNHGVTSWNVGWGDGKSLLTMLQGNYSAIGGSFVVSGIGDLRSSLEWIPDVQTSLKHQQNSSKLLTEYVLDYQYPYKAMSDRFVVKNIWERSSQDFSGRLEVTNPFYGHKNVLFQVKYIKGDEIKGLVSLDLDLKKFLASVKARWSKISDNNLVINLTTPFKETAVRFGVSGKDRHFVAVLETPVESLGVEGMFQVSNATNYNVMFNLATPLDVMNSLVILARRKEKRVEYKVGVNRFVVGVVASWHHDHYLNFDHTYKIFTPIVGYEETGVVAKIILENGLDSEFSLKAGEVKVGGMILVGPKDDAYSDLGFGEPTIENWKGLARLDTHVYKTITASFDIKRKDNQFGVLVTIDLPQGQIEVMDEMDLGGSLQAVNLLKIKTPFEIIKEVTSNGVLNTDHAVGTISYNVLLDLNVLSAAKWIKLGAEGNFIQNISSEGVQNFKKMIALHTPFKTLPYFQGIILENHDGPTHNLNMTLSTKNTTIFGSISSECTEDYLDLIAKCQVESSIFNLPPTKIHIQKNTSEVFNHLDFILETISRGKRHQAKVYWLVASLKEFDVEVATSLPVQPLENIHLRSSTHGGDSELYMIISTNSLHVNSSLKGSNLLVEALANFLNEEYVLNFNGVLANVSETRQKITGVVFYDNFPSNVTSLIDYQYDWPMEVVVDVVPSYDDDPIRVEYRVVKEGVRYDLGGSFARGSSVAKIEGKVLVNHPYNWNVLANIITPLEEYKSFDIETGVRADDFKNVGVNFLVKGTEDLEFFYEHEVSDGEGKLRSKHEFGELRGRVDSTWEWLRTGEEVKFKLVGDQTFGNVVKDLSLGLYYQNTNHSFAGLKLGGEIDVDKSVWVFGGDLSIAAPTSTDLDVAAKLKLPAPTPDTHAFLLKVDKNHGKLDAHDYLYETSYSTTSGVFYGITAGVTYADRGNINGSLKLNWGPDDSASIENILVLQQNKSDFQWLYSIKTPKYPEEETLKTVMTLRNDDLYHNFTVDVFHPGGTKIAKSWVNFSEITNMDGFVNVTTPIKGLRHVGIAFNVATAVRENVRRFEVFWTNNTALYFSKSHHKPGYGNQETVNGSVLLEVPLKTRHTFVADYQFEDKGVTKKGDGVVKLNGTEVLKGLYQLESESRAGANYTHQFEYNAPGEGLNYPTNDLKLLHLYHLKSAHHIKANLQHFADFSSEKLHATITDNNQTISFHSEYLIEDQVFFQTSRLNFTSDLFLGCDLKISNKTEDETFEAQILTMNLLSPDRNLTVEGSYNATNTSLTSQGEVSWNSDENHVLETRLQWHQIGEKQDLEVRLIHPSFEKDITVFGAYNREEKEANLTIDYCNDDDKKFETFGRFFDRNREGVYQIGYQVRGKHPDTDLDLSVIGDFVLDGNKIVMIGHNDGRYKRKIFATEYGTVDMKIDWLGRFYDYRKETRTTTSTSYGTYQISWPKVYGRMNRTYGEEDYQSGELYFNFKDKMVVVRVNLTEDGSQNFNIDGKIPDARSASVVVWRDYDDIRIVDMSYLLNLNHSRLIVSSFRWRPELKDELSSSFRTNFFYYLNYFVEELDNWNKYIRFEIVEELSDLWDSAKPYMEGYLEDIKALKVMKHDLDAYETYLNQTYYSNAFFLKQIIDHTYNATQGITKKSLPLILNETFDLIGSSTLKTLPKIFQSLQDSYQNFKSFLARLVNTDPMDLFKAIAESLFENSDEFMEETFKRTSQQVLEVLEKLQNLISTTKGDFMSAIEPVILEGGYYINQIWYHTVQDFVKYINERLGEIFNSSYFTSLTEFFGRFDGVYQDYIRNDFLTFLTKYLDLGMKYLNEKLFPEFDFKRAYEDVVLEIKESWEELKKNQIVGYCLEKVGMVWGKVRWVFENCEGLKGAGKFARSTYDTWTDMTLTALQAENKYRVPKTELIYDTKKGIIHLEQKLPMSWHAFNETPKFSEIPEIHALGQIQDFFTISNVTAWNFYQDYKPYAELLLPFDSRAMIIGGQHFLTFDRKYFRLRGSCSYLLARDFIDENFSLVVTYDPSKWRHYRLHLLTKNETITIDVSSKTISLDDQPKPHLPISTPTTYIFLESDILTVSSKSFKLRCNTKFDVCLFDLNGWYFGKTSGLFGTLNNEPFDDFLTSNGILQDTATFADSWVVGTCTTNTTSRKKAPENILQLCEFLFANKMSPFQSCFQKVDTKAFKNMCLASGSEKDVCTVGVGYIEACQMENTPLRIPDNCVKCKLPNGTDVGEGTFVHLNGTDVPKSSDIVFIVEAKDCNKDLRKNKSIDLLLSAINTELTSMGVVNNRYAVVVFGGDGILDKPRSILHGQVFTSVGAVGGYFDDIGVGGGSGDVFGAVNFAAELEFRAGVSKTFVLLPCSRCDGGDMEGLDYAALYQLLREYDITLHVLMDGEFLVEKGGGKVGRSLFGVDYARAYTKKDGKELKGDEDLRRQVKVSKATLGLCLPLALETNGTVFNARKLEGGKRSVVKIFAGVFAKRLAVTSVPSPCQTCECNAHDHGSSYMECFPCEYPSASLIEEDFTDSSPVFYDEDLLEDDQSPEED